jgi:hypothetical protein
MHGKTRKKNFMLGNFKVTLDWHHHRWPFATFFLWNCPFKERGTLLIFGEKYIFSVRCLCILQYFLLVAGPKVWKSKTDIFAYLFACRMYKYVFSHWDLICPRVWLGISGLNTGLKLIHLSTYINIVCISASKLVFFCLHSLLDVFLPVGFLSTYIHGCMSICKRFACIYSLRYVY